MDFLSNFANAGDWRGKPEDTRVNLSRARPSTDQKFENVFRSMCGEIKFERFEYRREHIVQKAENKKGKLQYFDLNNRVFFAFCFS